MDPSPVGAVMELVVGLAFLCAAVRALRQHYGHLDRHASLGVAVDVVVGIVAVADAASATMAGPPPMLLWGAASVVLLVALALLAHRRLHRHLPG